MLPQGGLRDAAINFDTSGILEYHRVSCGFSATRPTPRTNRQIR